MSELLRLARFSLTTTDGARLAEFYRAALDCELLMQQRIEDAQTKALFEVAGGAARWLLRLGEQRIELIQFDQPGAAYPRSLPASDLRFQHCAILVADIEAAFEQISAIGGWTPISRAGPERLPANTGGASAFKFRDPEGHPLELLGLPAQATQAASPLFLGIDHSAIAVSDTARSVAFYSSLGLSVTGRSLNQGPEQARLDDLSDPQVEVTALRFAAPGPHVELLCYRGTPHPALPFARPNDVVATRLIFEAAGSVLSLTDPDGHHLLAYAPDQNG